MNPRSVNSTNIKQFGFTVVADLELRKLIFDIAGLTTFETGGEANVLGVSFEVIDPAGVPIHTISFSPADIDTNAIAPFELPLPSGIALFGFYKIKGVIKEADASLYEIVIPPKEICEPKGFDGEVVEGSFKEIVDCASPFIRLHETSTLTYLNKKYSSITKTGNLYYPLGTVAAKSFTRTPYQTSEVRTGDFVVRNKTIADYDLGDNFFVRIGYETNHKFSVTCQSRLCDVTCCLEAVQKEWKDNCSTQRGRNAKEKIDAVTPYLFIATAREKCGKSAHEQIAEIKRILSCDCGDCNSHPVESTPVVQANGTIISVEGACAAEDVEVAVQGDGAQTVYTVKVKHVNVIKADSGDAAWSINKTEDDCNINWVIAFDYDELATSIYNATAANNTLLTLFNSLVASVGVQGLINGLNGKCVIDLNSCDYGMGLTTNTASATITSIIINGVTYAAPGGLNVSNAAGIQSWLNGLGKGTWAADYQAHVVPPGGILQFGSDANTNTIGTVTFTIDGEPLVKQFTSTCKTLKQILQAILDYICTLSTLQIKMGYPSSICTMDITGAKVIQSFTADYPLKNYLEKMSLAMCELASKITKATALDCSKINEIFTASSVGVATEDFVLMSKSGVCAKGTIKELALAIFKLAQTDNDVKSEFCAVNCGGSGACYSIEAFETETTAVA